VAKGLQAADEGDEGGMPRGPTSFNSRRASSASIPFGFKKLLLLMSSTCNMSRLVDCLQVAPQSSQSNKKQYTNLKQTMTAAWCSGTLSLGTPVLFNSI